jgi:K+-sensing histidine kinase KdpD
MEAELGNKSETLDTIRGEASRLSGFLTDMLMMAKMEHGRLKLVRTPTDINQMVTASVASFQPMAGLKEINLMLQLPHETKQLLVDTNLMRRVLDNLLSNALKFSPSAASITMQVEYPPQDSEKQVVICVTDEGPGVPEEHQETIFDKFQIVASKRRDVSQVGLGLAFCKMVVDAHNGRIFVEPNTPHGAIFTVEI